MNIHTQNFAYAKKFKLKRKYTLIESEKTEQAIQKYEKKYKNTPSAVTEEVTKTSMRDWFFRIFAI